MSILLKNLWRFFKSSASLCVWRFRTPNPPSDFGRQTSSHAAFGGDFCINISFSPKALFSVSVDVFDDSLMQFEGAHREYGKGCKNRVSDFQSASLR
jgi:hypothetical protein